MKKLTKKQKAQFPQYIARIDVLTSARDDYKGLKGYWQGYYTKAMEEQNITAAISKLDEVIETYGEDFYLVDLIGKTEKEDENGDVFCPYWLVDEGINDKYWQTIAIEKAE